MGSSTDRMSLMRTRCLAALGCDRGALRARARFDSGRALALAAAAAGVEAAFDDAAAGLAEDFVVPDLVPAFGSVRAQQQRVRIEVQRQQQLCDAQQSPCLLTLRCCVGSPMAMAMPMVVVVMMVMMVMMMVMVRVVVMARFLGVPKCTNVVAAAAIPPNNAHTSAAFGQQRGGGRLRHARIFGLQLHVCNSAMASRRVAA